MSRLLYTLLWHALLPLLPLRLLLRAVRQPAYLRHVPERFGCYARRPPAAHAPRPLWLHAVSLGEVRATLPLVRLLRQDYPDLPLLISCMTPTGRDAARELYGEQVQVVYLPYDLPWAVRAFLHHFRPQLGLCMETELWPNLIAACSAAGLPLLLINARLSARSARGYRRIAGLMRPALAQLAHVAAQTEADAARLQALGATSLSVCGNVKFDFTPPAEQLQRAEQFRQGFVAGRKIFLCASTREGEEQLLLDQRPQPWPDDWLWIIVPRHPQRFAEVEQRLQAAGLRVQRRSSDVPLAHDTQVWLGDSMGEMFAYLAASDLVFIGGSLLPFGAQNLIEAAAVGRAVLIGPHTFNFAEATRLAVQAGVAEVVPDAARLWQRVQDLLADAAERQRRGEAGLQFCASHRGAARRILQQARPWLPPVSPGSPPPA